MEFSDYIVYVDESGDPTLKGINEKYPVFVLAFCIFHKKHYTRSVVERLEQLKFKHFGHDIVVLHEREILQGSGEFKKLNCKVQKDLILNDLSQLISESNFIIISCVIRKDQLVKKYSRPKNPYFIALEFGLERIYRFLQEKQQHNKKTFIVFEQRGLKEDKDLELEFRRVCDGNNYNNMHYPFEIKLASKKVNSTGLQIADLVARPIGNNALRPQQPNRAFDVLKYKLYCSGGRKNVGTNYYGWGMKIFP